MLVWWLLLLALALGAAYSIVVVLLVRRRARIRGRDNTARFIPLQHDVIQLTTAQLVLSSLQDEIVDPADPVHLVIAPPPVVHLTPIEQKVMHRAVRGTFTMLPEPPPPALPRPLPRAALVPQYLSPVVFCTTCRNRTMHLRQTLPRNMADNPRSRFVVLNYSSEDDLLLWIFSAMATEIATGRLVVYSVLGEPRFRMAHAKNLGMRCGMLEGAKILVTLDADNFTRPGFEDFIEDWFRRDHNIFLCPRVIAQGGTHARIAPRGVAGRLAVRAQDFLKCGGYDEKYVTWQGEDVDIVARLKRMGYSPRFIDQQYLEALGHSSEIRFREYPHAKQYETDEEVKRINEEKHTVVNFGKIGCGTVYRNMHGGRVDFGPLPTRVFGVGFQRTGTTSLYDAFKILGFDSFHWEANDKARDIWDQMHEFGKSWMLERYYALCDNPIPILYEQLDKAYPGSKFILTVRTDEDAWLKSVQWLWSAANPARWEWDVWPFPNRIHREIYGRIDFDAETFLERYREHNREVVDYFRRRPGDLLVKGIGSGWDGLCEFLDVPVPDVPYPHANKG